jgi:hypothetical protein
MSFPAPTTGIGVAAKILVPGNVEIGVPAGKALVPGYNNVQLSLSGLNGQTTFQLDPQIVDVKNTPVAPGTAYTLTAVAASSGPGILTLTSVAASSGGTAVYTGTITGGGSNAWVGYSFTVAGFANVTNNGLFICTASTTTTLTLESPFAVAETHAATASSDEGVAVYTGTITEAANSLVGKTFVVAGFVTNPTNNGTFICTANNGTTTLTLANPDAVAETHAATATTQEQQWVDAVSAVASSTGVYTGTFPEFASFPVGGKVTIAGFVTNAVNNGTFVIVSATATTLTTTNTASVAETHAATATINPALSLTYFADGTAILSGYSATGPNTNLSTRTKVVTVSATGLITAGALGVSVVEVSYPTFANTIGATGAQSPNPMAGLPLMKIYAEVNVQVVA